MNNTQVTYYAVFSTDCNYSPNDIMFPAQMFFELVNRITGNKHADMLCLHKRNMSVDNSYKKTASIILI